MSDLHLRARGLLDFAEQSVQDAFSGPSSMLECLSEADHALRILGRILLKEDHTQYAKLALLGIFDTSFVRLAEGDIENKQERIKDALERVAFSKTLFNGDQ